MVCRPARSFYLYGKILNVNRVGKAYAISDVISLSYFYPQGQSCFNLEPEFTADFSEPEGLTGDITTTSRPLKDGESMEWILLSGVS